jgi:hypothetical protein
MCSNIANSNGINWGETSFNPIKTSLRRDVEIYEKGSQGEFE